MLTLAYVVFELTKTGKHKALPFTVTTGERFGSLVPVQFFNNDAPAAKSSVELQK